MKFVFRSLFFSVFLILLTTQCSDTDEGCSVLKDYRSDFDIELSEQKSTYNVGDEIIITASLPHTVVDNFNTVYSLEDEYINYNLDVLEVQADNLPIISADEKIGFDLLLHDGIDKEGISKSVRMNCEKECTMEISLKLNESGYFGILFKTGYFVSMVDCVVVGVNGIKNDINNIELLEEIGSEDLVFDESTDYEMAPLNSFFFKVVE